MGLSFVARPFHRRVRLSHAQDELRRAPLTTLPFATTLFPLLQAVVEKGGSRAQNTPQGVPHSIRPVSMLRGRSRHEKLATELSTDLENYWKVYLGDILSGARR